jgi:hypothetical protein
MTIHPGAIPPGATGVNIASIGGVTTLRAAIFLAGYAPTNIDTQTYLFPTRCLARRWPMQCERLAERGGEWTDI